VDHSSPLVNDVTHIAERPTRIVGGHPG
jgi:hypothetical protein